MFISFFSLSYSSNHLSPPPSHFHLPRASAATHNLGLDRPLWSKLLRIKVERKSSTDLGPGVRLAGLRLGGLGSGWAAGRQVVRAELSCLRLSRNIAFASYPSSSFYLCVFCVLSHLGGRRWSLGLNCLVLSLFAAISVSLFGLVQLVFA